MMELDSAPQFDWAHDAFVALNDSSSIQPSTEKWHPFASSTDSLNNMAFTIPPSLLTQTSVERYGQITPPEDLSPAEPRRDSTREQSIPVEQLRNEALWPEHQMHALQDYNRRHPKDSKQQQQQDQQPAEEPAQSQSQLDGQTQQPSPKRRRSGRQAAANQSQPNTAATPPQPQQNANTNPQPPKRKRGRPKSQPQLVEAYTTEGYPFQVSSARQSHLEKNRVAAHKCRQRKKEYINGLESRAREYSSKNKALKENVAMLREEVLELKNEVLRHAGCGFWAVDEYLARCAGDLLGMSPALGTPGSRKPSEVVSPTMSTIQTQHIEARESSAETLPSEVTDLSNDQDDYGGLELLRDFDDDMQDS